jgi:hypothetical protein
MYVRKLGDTDTHDRGTPGPPADNRTKQIPRVSSPKARGVKGTALHGRRVTVQMHITQAVARLGLDHLDARVRGTLDAGPLVSGRWRHSQTSRKQGDI